MRAMIEKTVWVGRTTMLLMALAVMLALTFGAASQVWAGKKPNSPSRLLVEVQGNNPTSTDVAAVSRLRTGVFLLEFKREVDDCHRLVSLGAPRNNAINPDALTPESGEASTESAFRGEFDDADRRLIVVATRNSAGTLEDKSFQLAVFCPVRR